MPNTLEILRQQELERIQTQRAIRKETQQTTDPFRGRARTQKRCEKCQLAPLQCICHRIPDSQCSCDFLILMHHDELLKPTNSGRLITDVFPNNYAAFVWSRTEPCTNLISYLNDPDRQCLLLFPPKDDDPRPRISREDFVAKNSVYNPKQGKKITLILLDGTWKQARKMYLKSEYLCNIPSLLLKPAPSLQADERSYGLRKAHATELSSTCEAAALALDTIGETQAGKDLLNYFRIFNESYLAMRDNLSAEATKERINSNPIIQA